MIGTRLSAFKPLLLYLVIPASLLLVDCDDSRISTKMAVIAGNYIYKTPTQLTFLEIYPDGSFKETITYAKDKNVFVYEGKWEQEGSSISFKPFFEPVDWETGVENFPPKQANVLEAELKSGVIIMNEHNNYWFNLAASGSVASE